jgi:DNA modification methylase
MAFEYQAGLGGGPVSFGDWIGGRRIQSIGSNAGADALPFQNWRHFKEAFAPELIQRAISESVIPVRSCVDPFGGSGTTALGCQFLGVRPITIEVNPYLADLIEAKLATYDVSSIARDFARLVRSANKKRVNPRQFFEEGPPTFVEPGQDDRWIFDLPVAKRLAAYVASLPDVTNPINRRLFRVLLGGVLVQVSNIVVSGKGRRYRRNWDGRKQTGADLDEAFCQSVENAVGDILRYGARAEPRYDVIRGDARKALKKVKSTDLAVFSPPYPNSFDYTDVYNIELWGLRYLARPKDNLSLRLSTLTSHVQIKREYAAGPTQSALLKKAIRALKASRGELWNRDIPEMIGGYFADISQVILGVKQRLTARGKIWMVVGDSRYAGVRVPVAEIITQLAPTMELNVLANESFRSMRSSAQQGGDHSLDESLLVLS